MKQLVPEWLPSEFVLMALPHKNSDWNYILDEALNQYKNILRIFFNENVKVILLYEDETFIINNFKDQINKNLFLIKAEYNDTWTRDYGPLTINETGILKAFDFGFNGWGLKFAADKDNLINLFLKDRKIISPERYVNKRDFILEGGSVEYNGEGIFLSTAKCLCSPNRNGGLDKKKVSDKLTEFFNLDKVLLLEHGSIIGDDTDSHIDTLARFSSSKNIVFTRCDDKSDPHYEDLKLMKMELEAFTDKNGNKFNLFELPLPDAIFDEDGNRLPATYANFLIHNNIIFMPSYSQKEKDIKAMAILKKAFPKYKVRDINCNTLIKQHGSLHCATMQIPAGIINKNILTHEK